MVKEPHGHLPASIDPIQLAERGARLTGTLPLKSMPRLMQTALDDSGDVQVDLAFEREEGEKVFVMHGTLRARLKVTCQRCLEGMDLDIEASPWLILQRSAERAEREDADVLVSDKPLSLSGLAEDELLLVMPMAPLHEAGKCPAGIRAARAAGTAGSKPSGQNRKNPFSVLSKLKKR